jgi:hypothetical protein
MKKRKVKLQFGKEYTEPGPVAHACYPCYSEAEIRRIAVQSQPTANSSARSSLENQKKG